MSRVVVPVRTRWALGAAAAAAAVGLAALVRGGPGATAVLIGAGAVVLFLTAGSIPARIEPVAGAAQAFLLLVTGYVLRILGLLVLFAVLHGVSWVDRQVLGATVIAAALAWTVVAIYAHRYSQRPIIPYLPPVQQ